MDCLKLAGLFLVSTSLIGCATHQKSVPNALPTSEQTATLTGAGAVTGAAVGAIASSNTVAGAATGGVIGGAAGALVGYFKDSPSSLAKKLDAQGIQVVAVGQTLKFIIFTDKCFEFGTSTITKSCQNTLNDMGTLLKQTGNKLVLIDAYTDNVFQQKFADNLSQNEAEAIMAYFWAHGIPYQRMVATGHGSADPIATNYTPHGRYLNRRVEISFG